MRLITISICAICFFISCCPPDNDVNGLIGLEVEIIDSMGKAYFGANGTYPFDSLLVELNESGNEIFITNDGFNGSIFFDVNVRDKEPGIHEFSYIFKFPIQKMDTLLIKVDKSEFDKCGNFDREIIEILYNGDTPETDNGRFLLISK